MPSFRTWLLAPPGMQTREMEGRRRQSLWEMNVGLPSGTYLASTTSPKALRTGAFNACSRLSLASRLPYLRASRWAHHQCSARRGRLRVRPCLPMGARTTIRSRTSDGEHGVAPPILRKGPAPPGLASGTGGALLLPIPHHVFSSKSGALTCLPRLIVSGRTKAINPSVLLAAHEGFCIHRARLHDTRCFSGKRWRC